MEAFGEKKEPKLHEHQEGLADASTGSAAAVLERLETEKELEKGEQEEPATQPSQIPESRWW